MSGRRRARASNPCAEQDHLLEARRQSFAQDVVDESRPQTDAVANERELEKAGAPPRRRGLLRPRRGRHTGPRRGVPRAAGGSPRRGSPRRQTQCPPRCGRARRCGHRARPRGAALPARARGVGPARNSRPSCPCGRGHGLSGGSASRHLQPRALHPLPTRGRSDGPTCSEVIPLLPRAFGPWGTVDASVRPKRTARPGS